MRTEEGDERLLAVKGPVQDFVSSSCTSGKKSTGADRGCEPRPAPRNQSSSREGSGLKSVDLKPDTHGCPGKHGCQLVTIPEGGSPIESSSSEDDSPSPMLRSTSDPPGVHWIKCWQPREADQRNHLGAEQDDRAIRGPWGLVRWRSSYCNHQFSQSASRQFSARAREVLGWVAVEGCPSFHKREARSQRVHAHTLTVNAWVIHKRSFSVLGTQTLKKTIVSVLRRRVTTATKRTRTERTSLKRCEPSMLCSFRKSALLVEVPNRCRQGHRCSHRNTNQEQLSSQIDERFCGDQHCSPTRLRSKNLKSGYTCLLFIPICIGSGSGV